MEPQIYRIQSIGDLMENFNLTREKKLCESSFGEIMQAFSQITIKKRELKAYEYFLKSWFQVSIPNIVNEYLELLEYKTKKQWAVNYFNLIGPLPPQLYINEEEHNMILKKSNLGNLLKALKNRIHFMLNRDIPPMYLHDCEYLEHFNDIRSKLKMFDQNIDNFEKEFVKAIDMAHHVNDI